MLFGILGVKNFWGFFKVVKFFLWGLILLDILSNLLIEMIVFLLMMLLIMLYFIVLIGDMYWFLLMFFFICSIINYELKVWCYIKN